MGHDQLVGLLPNEVMPYWHDIPKSLKSYPFS